jgi:hypothetical protein
MNVSLPPALVRFMQQQGYRPEPLKQSGSGFLRFPVGNESNGNTSGYVKSSMRPQQRKRPRSTRVQIVQTPITRTSSRNASTLGAESSNMAINCSFPSMLRTS